MKPQESSRRINDPGLIATCHCGAEYETKYSALIETHTTTLIDITHQKSIDITNQESVNSNYKEERAIEYRAILDEEDRLLHHSSWKKNAPSIDRTVSTSIETHPYQTSQKQALTDIAYFQSIDTGVDHIREGDYLIGSWTDDHHHEIYAVETTVHEPGADELHEGFTYEELLNMQRHPHVYYNHNPAMKPQESSRRINDPGLIATCHCGAEYDTKYSALIKTHTTTLIDITHQKSIDITNQESDYDEDYKEERAIEYRAILDEEDRLLHHSSWKKNAPSIDRTVSTSIETHPYQTSQKRALTDIAYFQSIDTGVDHIREGDYLIGSWTDDHHHEICAVETTVHEPGADELHEGFTYEELLNMQRRDEEDQYQAETRNDDFWQVVKQEKLQEEDFEVESSMSFGGSHWCQSAPDFEHRSTDFNQNRSTGSLEHRSTTPMESTASCNALRIMTHEEFTA
ncbi:hypothetical protein F2Q69_00042370 [Brassica cretica]|uniref:Uncharacterized protein n=1 Tax=Brassica cretica TaxID=69181 RepID=A0A8S9NAM2_BRACR|nr:hypothetical protein F2Q69_00042370 [Brassica cretica]